MYRNVAIAGLLGAMIGGGVGTLACGATGVHSTQGTVQLSGERLLDDGGRPAGRCVARSGAAACELRYTLEGGDVRASGALRPDRSGVLAITGGTGD